ncbi:hypothetical protein DMN91_006996 [Ooceraea biroi]|uniref:Multidrug resistance-associated protein n=1 Tax=Ooceraea biroi TaxID=2015173 RepID=A0A3L8DIZ7_OOCBI|nr:multidrug resistance-associated protein 4 [Ooceraea biroi]RLU20387.1 hypothetical protein DMN91_006996 [Ooceraea biroi]
MNKDSSGMKKNPKETANLISQLFFWWMFDLFRKGVKTDLEESDMYQPLKADHSELATDLLEKAWNRELEKLKKLEYTVTKDGQKKPLKKNDRPKLYKAIFRAFWLPYSIVGIFVFIQCSILRVIQPFLQGQIINYFNMNEADRDSEQSTLLYVIYLVICTAVMVAVAHHSNLVMQQIGMRVRVACCSLIYRKLLRLNRSSLSQIGAGHIINLLSNDVIRFDIVTLFLHYLWLMPIQMVIVGYIMWEQIGISTFVGIGLLLVIAIPIQGSFSLLSRRIRAIIAPQTDRRVQLMSELIAGIQVVKMYAWEKPFTKIVSLARKLEIQKIQFQSFVRAAYLAIIVFTERLLLYFTLLSFILLGNELTANVTYTLSVFFNLLQLVTALYFPMGLNFLAETIVSMNRLEEILLMEEVNMERPEMITESQTVLQKSNVAEPQGDKYIARNESAELTQSQENPVCVDLRRVSANWINGQLPPTLCNISMTIKPGNLCALVGPVGSGKSSVLHLLLRELNPGAGTIVFTQTLSENIAKNKLSNGYFADNPNLRISYASQEAWLFGGTVRENILFGQPYDKDRYVQVTNVCALIKDFRQFPQGDMTIVGDRGVSLSGGQRARINLARAVYRQADLYLLDDPLSAVDTHVARHLYKKCITEYLHNKTRILVTHQLQFLKQADHIVMLDRGFIKTQGSYNELVKSDQDFIEMIHILDHQAQKREENVRRTSEMSSARKNSSLIRRVSQLSTASSTAYSDVDEYVGNNLEGEEMEHGQLSSKVFKEYLLHGGGYFMLFILLMLFVISQVATSGNDYWVSYWTNMEALRRSDTNSNMPASDPRHMRNNSLLESIFTLDSDGLISTIDALKVYTFCIVSCTITTLIRSFLFMKICMNASRNLHNSMFSNLIQTRMSFFNTNPSGRILNRFSKDAGTMDELLSRVMLESLQTNIVISGILVMEIIINYWMLIPLIILSILFLVIIKFYLRTAQNIKRVEGVTKSPVYSHINSTLNGLPTIRSSGDSIEKMMRNQFDVLQDYNSGAWYLVLVCQELLGFMLDLIVCVFIACLCFSFVFLAEYGNVLSADVGLGISQALILTGTLQFGIRQLAESFSLLTAVERILQYTKLPKEEIINSSDPPPPTWPSQGRLIFKNVNMKYDKDDPPVLKNLNISIEPGWKVGVVGRTGAGKSSLISALFRLFNEGMEGEIRIDGRDTSTVNLQELRSKISIIPQEPVLFSESLRYNLDPFNKYDDVMLWEVLRQVELNDVALDQPVLYGGHNFSVGQRQLICLARAILRNNRLLVLDEATANIDSTTDALIQDTIRRNFKECTVITIAHRLNTIIDSDRIIVMEGGHIVEFGTPYELLRDKPDGYFSQMVQKTGSQMAQNLLQQAEKAYRKNNDLDLSSQNSDDSNVTVTEQSAL